MLIIGVMEQWAAADLTQKDYLGIEKQSSSHDFFIAEYAGLRNPQNTRPTLL